MRKVVFYISLILTLISCNEYSIKNNVVEFDSKKFTVLSPNLITARDAQISEGNYNYNFDLVEFDVKQVDDELVISTKEIILFYQKGNENIKDGIRLQFTKNDSTIVNRINQIDTKNLGGLIRSVDRFDGKIEYEQYDINSSSKLVDIPKGLLSEQGWTVLKSVDGRLLHNDIEGISSELFVFGYGDNYKTALNDFTTLNGKIPMLPKWSLGNWYSRYQPLTAVDYKRIVKRFRKEKIPIDVIVPDMNWHIDGWFGTRYDSVKFPDMKNFLKWTNENGIHVGFNHHPGAVIRDDVRAKYFLKKVNMDYDSLLVTTEKQYQESKWEFIENALYYGEGDSKHIKPFFDVFLKPIMDEGLDFHWVDGSPSIENLKEYYNATEQFANKRAIVLTRQVAGSFDNHKYPIGFSGDSYISWESLKFNIELTVKGSNLGIYWSHDIGGHMEGYKVEENSELFTRWIQSGVMTPFNRLHATGGVDWDKRMVHNRKPWAWGEQVLKSARKAMQLKYKLLPYTYSLTKAAHDNGLIMNYAMYMDFPNQPKAYEFSNLQYMFGPSLLVAPITSASLGEKGMKGKGSKTVWFPEGVWYDYFSGEKIEGPIEKTVLKTINEFPLFVKEGAIIPMMKYMEYTNQKPLDELIVEFYHPSAPQKSMFDLYEDDGETLAYQNKEFRSTTISYNYDIEKGSSIIINPTKGNYKEEVKTRSYQLIIKHLKKLPEVITLNGQFISKKEWSIKNNHLYINIRKLSVKEKIQINFK